MSKTRSILIGTLAFIALNGLSLVSHAQIWAEQGPGPTTNGQVEGIPGKPVSGAVEALAAVPGDANTIYAATVNGGIWKTTNGTAASPTWTPLTDQALTALSMNSLAISPVNTNVIYGGTGSVSSFGDGNSGIGVAKSVDGGATWATLAAATFAGRAINSIVPTSLGGGNVILAASLFGGAFRSIDGAVSFTQLSGAGGTNLPAGGVSSLVADPSNTNRFYAALPGTGIYISTDGGQTWAQVNTGLAGVAASQRILLSVQPTSGNVYAMIISGGTLSGVFRTTNQGGTWTPMGVPGTSIFPGGQGGVHGAIVAHPTNPDVAFITGDRQNGPFPNGNGCNDFSLNAFRLDATGPTYANIVCAGAAGGTSPHADSRSLVFDANGNMLLGCDGGVYRLATPDVIGRLWSDMNGNIRPTEFHSVAYDSLSSKVFGGAQDTGSPHQTGPGFQFDEKLTADGANVGVDDDQTAHAGTSIRYTSFQFLGAFNRSTWNAAGAFVSSAAVGLAITSGPGTGLNLKVFDTVGFYQPYAINRINPARMLIATTRIYESTDKGDTLADVDQPGLGSANCLTYGGRLNGVDEPNVFYVGFNNGIRHRVSGPITTLTAYPGAAPLACVMDLQDYRRIFVVDVFRRVWASLDEGVTWINITGNLPLSTSRVLSIESFRPANDTNGTRAFLIVGTDHGAYRMYRPGTGMAPWAQTGTLPNTLLFDTHYDYTNDVLVAGMLGRGGWTLGGYFANNPLPTK